MTRIMLFVAVFVASGYSFPGQAQPLPSSHFSRLPQFQQPQLSPSGNQVAYLFNSVKPEATLMAAANLKTGETHYLLSSDNEDVKINWFTWANEKTLLISARYATRRSRVKTTETRLYALEADGSKEPYLVVKPRGGRFSEQHVGQFQDKVIDFLPDDPEHILMALDYDTANMPSVYKVSLYSRRMSRVQRGKMQVRTWYTDQQSRLRAGYALDYEEGTARLLVRNDEDADWRELFTYNALTEPSVSIAGFDLDPDILYYKAYQNDKRALFKVTLSTNEHSLVFADPEYDVDGALIYSAKTRDVIGIRHANSETGRIYWDEKMAAFQQAIQAAMPDFDNYLVDFSRDERRYLVYSESDNTPGIYLYGDRDSNQLSKLFDQYPELMSTPFPENQHTSYIARDGQKIEGYLTLPASKEEGPFPLILHPHGGPGARDFSGFDHWTAFFTNQGYAVFRPNFRGSSGYGYTFSQSQMKGWGLQMQDDLTDAAHWLVNEKIAQPDKMCIVGASYGGYAAAMAAVKTPDLFKCAVSFAGVSNLKSLVIKGRKYISSSFIKNQIGDDYDDLEARSPYYQAEHVNTPMLIVHGEDDRVVDVSQSRDFAYELEDEGKRVTYIELESGDHYLSIQRNRHRFFTEVQAFLSLHLKTGEDSDVP